MFNFKRNIIQFIILTFIWGIILTIIHYLSIGVNREGWPLLFLGTCLVIGGFIVTHATLKIFRKFYYLLSLDKTEDIDISDAIKVLNDQEREILTRKIRTLAQSRNDRLSDQEEETFEDLLSLNANKQKRR